MSDHDTQMALLGALVDFEFACGGGVDQALARVFTHGANLPGSLFRGLLASPGEPPIDVLRRAACELGYFPLAILAESCAAAARGELNGRLSAGALAYVG